MDGRPSFSIVSERDGLDGSEESGNRSALECMIPPRWGLEKKLFCCLHKDLSYGKFFLKICFSAIHVNCS